MALKSKDRYKARVSYDVNTQGSQLMNEMGQHYIHDITTNNGSTNHAILRKGKHHWYIDPANLVPVKNKTIIFVKVKETTQGKDTLTTDVK